MLVSVEVLRVVAMIPLKGNVSTVFTEVDRSLKALLKPQSVERRSDGARKRRARDGVDFENKASGVAGAFAATLPSENTARVFGCHGCHAHGRARAFANGTSQALRAARDE